MNSNEWNKVVGALLVTALFFVMVNIAADDLFEIEQPEIKGYKVEGVEVATIDAPVVVVVEGPSLASRLAGASAEKGARVYGRCAACHSLQEGGPHGIGPNLYGIVGAKVGGRADFSYSDALENHGGEWDFALLDAYIEKPSESIPGNRMPFAGIDRANQRADLIAFLSLQAADPVPLPEAGPVVAPEQPAAIVSNPESIEEAAIEEPAVVPPEEAAPKVVDEPVKQAAAEVAAVEVTEAMAESSPLATALAAASLERGEAGFATCAICHSIDKGGANKIGPNLYGVVGGPVGQHQGFAYSPALAGHGGTWSYGDLDAFLTSPSAAIPGNRMPFGGIKSPIERADLILYLRSRNDDPPALPE